MHPIMVQIDDQKIQYAGNLLTESSSDCSNGNGVYYGMYAAYIIMYGDIMYAISYYTINYMYR